MDEFETQASECTPKGAKRLPGNDVKGRLH